MKQLNQYSLKLGAAALVAILAGCGGGGGQSGGTEGASVFPTGLAIASPVAMTDGALVLAQRSPSQITRQVMLALGRADFSLAARLAQGLLPIPDALAATRSPAYLKSANRINALLTGAATPSAGVAFNAAAFLRTPVNAGCYGPTILYEGHPDGLPNSGTLPSGDVGMWSTIDSASSAACAAAQLDARMDGVSLRVNTGLMTLASLINVASAAGKSLPAVGGTVDLLAEMNAALGPTLTFTTASIAQPLSGSYTYRVEFSFVDGAATRKAEIRLTHAPGGSRNAYSGLLTYAVTRGAGDLQNCPPSSGGTLDVGSLKYTRNSSTSMTLVHREGNYCGNGTATPLASSYANFSGDGQLDPAGKWNGSKGWANNFNRFGAQYDPTTLKGSYAFGWQAGHGDSHSRVFNIGLNFNAGTELRDGEAYFGYGSDISGSDGKIQGFICNWAGPGNSHVLSDYFQRQHITFNDTTGLWRPTGEAASSSNIGYAPTNSCDVPTAGTAFYYDKNADGSLADEKAVVPNPAVATNLADRVFGPTTYATIPLAIAGRGMTVPGF